MEVGICDAGQLYDYIGEWTSWIEELMIDVLLHQIVVPVVRDDLVFDGGQFDNTLFGAVRPVVSRSYTTTSFPVSKRDFTSGQTLLLFHVLFCI